MKTEEQNEAIAEACGWIQSPNDPGFWRLNGKGYAHSLEKLPRYTECLNACADMEKALSNAPHPDKEIEDFTEQEQYVDWLERITNSEWGLFKEVTAIAAHRCEAFLKVKGLWTETPADNDDE